MMIAPKPSVSTLKPYVPDEHQCAIKLDANEAKPFLFPQGLQFADMPLHRYPDPGTDALKKSIAAQYGVNPGNIMTGNGSSALIELVIKTFVAPGEVVISFKPSFAMFGIYSRIHGADFSEVDSEADFSFDLDKMITAVRSKRAKLVILCSPNNPTGYLIPKAELVRFLQSVDALVLVDEAYMEFADQGETLIHEIGTYTNLIVTRTFSKAFGLAGIRLGYLFANPSLVDMLGRVQEPYHLNTITQVIGCMAMSRMAEVKTYTASVRRLRQEVMVRLRDLGIKTYPSSGNFIWFETEQKDLYQKLIAKDILIRAFGGQDTCYFRVTIGDEQENNAFINALKEILS